MSSQTARSAGWGPFAILLIVACGAAPPRLAPDGGPALACDGEMLTSEAPILVLGLLPSGDPVTAGIALTCRADHLEVLDWGPDSSAAYTIPREHAMEAWDAFRRATTQDERRLVIGRYRTPHLSAREGRSSGGAWIGEV